MYSILIRSGTAYSYYQAEEGINFTGTLAETKAEVISLLKKGTALNTLVVVHNTTIDLSSLAITDVTE